jgi:tetratricopeptide (TPR) repeat protein
MGLRGLLILCVLAISATAASAQRGEAPPALADDPVPSTDMKARKLFQAGRLAYREGQFDTAVENFRAAYELSPRAGLLFNLGMAAERARRDQEALQAYESYLKQEPEAHNRSYVESRIEFLREVLADDEAAAEGAADGTAEAGETRPGPAAAVAPDPAADSEGDGGSLLSRWWFWGAIGVGVAALTTTVIVASSGEDDPIRGDVGGVVTTLRRP